MGKDRELISEFGFSISDFKNANRGIEFEDLQLIMTDSSFLFSKSEIENPNSEIKLKHYFCKNLLKNGSL